MTTVWKAGASCRRRCPSAGAMIFTRAYRGWLIRPRRNSSRRWSAVALLGRVVGSRTASKPASTRVPTGPDMLWNPFMSLHPPLAALDTDAIALFRSELNLGESTDWRSSYTQSLKLAGRSHVSRDIRAQQGATLECQTYGQGHMVGVCGGVFRRVVEEMLLNEQ